MRAASTAWRRWEPTFWRLFRFCLVGVANTLVYYLGYRLLLLAMPWFPAHLVAWAVSVVFSFFMNCWFTYRVRPTWKRFVAFPASTLVNLLFTSLGSAVLVELIHFDERYATLVMGILAIPFTFAVTTLVLTKGINADDQTR
ncbi:GtrA family protein [Luteococcus sp. OSA5]|uniref:GtrA family protein n=1 Tax=Luteococcus sp. OSA5 TaxID=3401630 RepID=UPI003B43D12C